MSTKFSHFDDAGNARMVDVGGKVETVRVATAEGKISMIPAAYEMVRAGTMKKGDVLGVARIAGIMAAKKVDSLIPLCHPLAITKADISFSFDDDSSTIAIMARASHVRTPCIKNLQRSLQLQSARIFQK